MTVVTPALTIAVSPQRKAFTSVLSVDLDWPEETATKDGGGDALDLRQDVSTQPRIRKENLLKEGRDRQ